MRSSTLAILLFILAGVFLTMEVLWLFVVFVALALAMLFFYKEAPPEFEDGYGPNASTDQQPYPQQQVIVMQPERGELNKELASEIVKHIELDSSVGHSKKVKKDLEELKSKESGDIKSLKKEIVKLKAEIKKDKKK